MDEEKIEKAVEDIVVDDIKKIHKDYGTFVMPICALIIVIAIALVAILIKGSITSAAKSVGKGYSKAVEDQYQIAYKKAYDKAYEENKLSQKVSISIGDIKEISRLEVLKVSEQSYTVQDNETKKQGISYWTKNTVFGIYTVDLTVAEFIVDTNSNYILVRIPEPVLTIAPSGVYETLLFKKQGTDGNDRAGSELAKKQLKAGEASIRESIEGNQNYRNKAKDAAVETIKNLIHVLNPDNASLEPEVVFFD